MVDTAEFERDLLGRIVQNIKPSKAAVFSGQNYQMSVSHGVETDQTELNMELVEKVVQTEGPVSDKVHKRQLAVPYKNADGKVLGVMYVEIAAPRRLKFRDLAILQGLGRQMVERHSQPLSTESEKAHDPEMMGEVTRYVRSTLSIVSSVLKPQRVLILVRLEEGPKIVASRGFDDVQNLAEVPFSRELVDSVWEKGETCHIRDAKNDPQYSQFAGVKEHSLRSVCICPLNKLDGEDRGLIYLDSCKDPAEFLTAEVSILQRLALALEKDLARVLAPDPEGGAGDVLSSPGSSILDNDNEYSLPDATPYLDEPDSFIVSDEEEPEAEEAEVPSQPEEVSDEYRPTELFSENEEGEAEDTAPAEDDLAGFDPPELSYEAELELESDSDSDETVDELSDFEPEPEEDEPVAERVADEEVDSNEAQESEPETAGFEEANDSEPDADVEESEQPEADVEEVEELEADVDVEKAEEFETDVDSEEVEEPQPEPDVEEAEDLEADVDAEEVEEPEPEPDVEEVEELEADISSDDVEEPVAADEDEESEEAEANAGIEEVEEPDRAADAEDGEEPETADDSAQPQSKDEVAEALAEIEAADSFEDELAELDEEFPDSDQPEQTFEETEVVDREPDEEEPTTEQSGDSSPPPLLDLYDGSPLSGAAEFQYEPSENDVVTITLPPQLLDGGEDEEESDEIEPTVEETPPVLNQEADREVESVRSLPVDATVEVSAEIAARALAGVRALQEQQEPAEEEPEVENEDGEHDTEQADLDDAEKSAEEAEAEEATQDEEPEPDTAESETDEASEAKNDTSGQSAEEEDSTEVSQDSDDEEADGSGDDEAEELDDEEESSEESTDEADSAEDVEAPDESEDDDVEEDDEVDSEESPEESEEADESEDEGAEEDDEVDSEESTEESQEADDSDDEEEESEVEEDSEDETHDSDDDEDEELEDEEEEADEPPPKVEPAAQAEPVATRESAPPREVAEQEESLMKYVERGLQAVTPAKNASFWERLKWVFSPESVPQGGNYSHIHISGKVVLQDNDWKGSEPIEVTLSFPSHKMTVVLELAKGESDYAYHGRFEGESPVWFEVTVEKPGYFPIKLSKVTFRAGEVDSEGEPTTRVHEITLIPRRS